jgi:hypothetical protein
LPMQPEGYPRRLMIATFAILVAEVLVQAFQYKTGEPIGDNLAGLFGKNGTGNLVLFLVFTCSLFLAYWIMTKKWLPVVAVLLLSTISSVLGEMKLFAFAIIVVGALAVLIFSIRNHSVFNLLKYAAIMLAVVALFFYLYNALVPDTGNFPLQRYLTDPQFLDSYLNYQGRTYKDGQVFTDIGRNAAIGIGWESIKTDPVTFLFGWGLGARSESTSLAIQGQGLKLGGLGASSGTSLLIIMQEMGVIGLIGLAFFIVWTVYTLVQDIRKEPDAQDNILRYAMIIYSICFPIWIWYGPAWASRFPMLLYWSTFGYLMARRYIPNGLSFRR